MERRLAAAASGGMRVGSTGSGKKDREKDREQERQKDGDAKGSSIHDADSEGVYLVSVEEFERRRPPSPRAWSHGDERRKR